MDQQTPQPTQPIPPQAPPPAQPPVQTPPSTPAPTPSQKKASPGKKILFIVITAILVAAIGVGAWFAYSAFFANTDNTTTPDDQTQNTAVQDDQTTDDTDAMEQMDTLNNQYSFTGPTSSGDTPRASTAGSITVNQDQNTFDLIINSTAIGNGATRADGSIRQAEFTAFQVTTSYIAYMFIADHSNMVAVTDILNDDELSNEDYAILFNDISDTDATAYFAQQSTEFAETISQIEDHDLTINTATFNFFLQTEEGILDVLELTYDDADQVVTLTYYDSDGDAQRDAFEYNELLTQSFIQDAVDAILTGRTNDELIATIQEIQVALEAYYNDHSTYPQYPEGIIFDTDAALCEDIGFIESSQDCVGNLYITKIPGTDIDVEVEYNYKSLGDDDYVMYFYIAGDDPYSTMNELGQRVIIPEWGVATPDGLAAYDESELSFSEYVNFSFYFTDSDEDGLTDAEETTLGTDLFDTDSDQDGLNDYDEVMTWETDPLLEDTDGDGYGDGVEVENGYNPNGEGTIEQ